MDKIFKLTYEDYMGDEEIRMCQSLVETELLKEELFDEGYRNFKVDELRV